MTGQNATTSEGVRNELERVLSSCTFQSVERQKQFLEYVVSEKIAGREDRIKAYSIAVSAFGRSEDFDPQQDSIVRIEAGRLRRSLEHYYLTEGVDNEIQIVIPKGTYVPEFAVSGESVAYRSSQQVLPTPHRAPRVFVETFKPLEGNTHMPELASELSRQIIMALTRFGTLFVYGPTTSEKMTEEEGLASLHIDFILSGRVASSEEKVTIDLLLQDCPSGRYVWTERVERELVPNELYQMRDDVAAQIAQMLAQPHGIIASRALDQDGQAPSRLGSFRAVLNFYRYLQSFDASMLESVQSDLEMAIKEDPTFAEAYACLSQVYANTARFRNLEDSIGQVALKHALELARTAILLAPHSSSAHHALGFALWFSGQPEEGLEAYRKAYHLNPNDTGLMADLGLRLALRMEWDEAVHLVTEAFRRNPCQPPAFHIALSLYHFMEGRFEAALKEANSVEAPDVVYGYIMVAASAAELGCKDKARSAVSKLEKLAPGYGRRLEADLQARSLHPEIIAAVVQGLQKAGLPGVHSVIADRSFGRS